MHYKDVYDLYSHIENELYTGLGELFEKSNPYTNEKNLMDLIDNIMDYISLHHDIFKLFIQLDFNGNVLSRLKKYFYDKVLHECIILSRPININGTDYDKVEANFIVSGVIGVLEDWLTDGMVMPRENVSVILQRILEKF
ncbi:AcrR family transcriptional regulator [Clostridium sp. CT7]|nr:AcrR family transcriptional regulator [Clostridium sp. CT7]